MMMMMKGRGHTQLSAGKPEIDNSVSCQRLLIIIVMVMTIMLTMIMLTMIMMMMAITLMVMLMSCIVLSVPHSIITSSSPFDQNFHHS